MMVLFLSALLMGGVGSLHCIGMCGPIALALPLPGHTVHSKFIGSLLYNVGRIVTYTCFGITAGTIGASFSLFGIQQWLSVICGFLIIIYLLYPKLSLYKHSHFFLQNILGNVRTRLANLFKTRKYSSLFFIGLLNGLLPCGLLYIALAAALAAGSVIKSSLFMALFGLGTLPLMWAIVFFGANISFRTRSLIRKAYPYILFFMACLLIIRGLGLGIPYLSPQVQGPGSGVTETVSCHS